MVGRKRKIKPNFQPPRWFHSTSSSGSDSEGPNLEEPPPKRHRRHHRQSENEGQGQPVTWNMMYMLILLYYIKKLFFY